MKELGIVLDFNAKMLTIDEIILPMRKVNLLQGASTLCVLKLKNSLAMDSKSTLDATKQVTQMLDAKYNKADLQSIVRDDCLHLSANQQQKLLQLLMKYELLFNGTLGDWNTMPVSAQLKEDAMAYPQQSFPSTKNTQECPHQRS
jgi:hypothetical protein